MAHTRTTRRQKSSKTTWKPHVPSVPRCDYCGLRGCKDGECAERVAAEIQSELDFEEYGMSREDYLHETLEFVEQLRLDEEQDEGVE